MFNTVPPKVLMRIPVSPNSGYGNDGIQFTMALLKAGVDVRLHPTALAPPIPVAIAQLLTKSLDAPFDLFINHVDPMQLECSPEARQASVITVAHTMWEFESLGNLKGRSTMRKRLTDFDLFLGYSETTLKAFEPYLGKTPSAMLQGGYDPDLWPYVERDWNSPRFSFIMHGNLNLRKDPHVAIQAYIELKNEYPEEFEPAEMHIHTTDPGLPKVMETVIPKFRIHYETWPIETVRQFYQSGHVLISPSHGEGKNLPCLEMLSTGGSVIATAFSGHMNWLSDAYAYPLDCEIVPVHKAKYGEDCKWAAADREHLKSLMMQAFRNRQEVKRKGELGAQIIPQMCSWDRVVQDLFRTIGDKIPGKGQELQHRFDALQRERKDAR